MIGAMNGTQRPARPARAEACKLYLAAPDGKVQILRPATGRHLYRPDCA
jgi:hypothetical protein